MESSFNEFENVTLDGKQKRKLLPWWIKVFIWIFMVFGVIAPIGLVFGLLGYEFTLSLYGIETNKPISIMGLVLIAIFLYKGISAFGLWTGKKWAIEVARIDAILGFIICVFSFLIIPIISDSESIGFSFRLEILLLIPYFLKLNKIQKEW